MKKTIFRCPKKEGRINIYPEIIDERYVNVTIIGDPDGLRYLAKLLIALADYDQEVTTAPVGDREHIHLHANEQLDSHSCDVELCRADAKGTGVLPDFMK